MSTWVALLRGINVGGRHRLPMATVREVLDEAGFARVRTYIQSGNIVLDAPGPAEQVAARVRGLLEQAAGFPVPVVVLAADEVQQLVADNPFRPELDKLEHVVVLPQAPSPALCERLQALAEADDSDDELAVGPRWVYLHHPQGLTASRLAQQAMEVLAEGTARNLASMRRLELMACPQD